MKRANFSNYAVLHLKKQVAAPMHVNRDNDDNDNTMYDITSNMIDNIICVIKCNISCDITCKITNNILQNIS